MKIAVDGLSYADTTTAACRFEGISLVTRVLIIVQNLPVPFDRRVWLECQALVSAGYQVAVVCPKGKATRRTRWSIPSSCTSTGPTRPAAASSVSSRNTPTRSSATAWLTLKARRSGRFAVIQACNPPDIFWPIALVLRAVRPHPVRVRSPRPVP